MWSLIQKSVGKNISQEFRMKNKDCLIEEINQNELMSKKHKKVYRVLNYVEHIFILISTVSGCISISLKTSNEITSSAIGLKICAVTA